MARLRTNRVCFTINNYELEDLTGFLNYEPTYIKYLVVGQEIGENGTPHLQGFIHLDKDPKKCGIKFWKAEIPGGQRAHFEQARGTDEQNRDYCTKDGPWIEIGQPQQETNKYKLIYETVKRDLYEAVEIDHEWGMAHFNQLKALHEELNKPTMDKTLTELRPWQITAIEKLKNQSDRRILFIVDKEGGKGKSALAKHLISSGNTWACQGKVLWFGKVTARPLRSSRVQGGDPP